MSDNAAINLGPADTGLAALVLIAALDDDAGEKLAVFLPYCPQLDAARADFIMPLITDMARAPEGVEAVLELISAGLPPALAEAVYMLAADYVAGFGAAMPEQIRLLERLAESLQLDRLTRAALDRAALARARELKQTAID